MGLFSSTGVWYLVVVNKNVWLRWENFSAVLELLKNPVVVLVLKTSTISKHKQPIYWNSVELNQNVPTPSAPRLRFPAVYLCAVIFTQPFLQRSSITAPGPTCSTCNRAAEPRLVALCSFPATSGRWAHTRVFAPSWQYKPTSLPEGNGGINQFH